MLLDISQPITTYHNISQHIISILRYVVVFYSVFTWCVYIEEPTFVHGKDIITSAANQALPPPKG
jgi:hypothetical protein